MENKKLEGLDKQQWQDFIFCAQTDGWESAVKKYIKTLDISYIKDERRADWSFLLPFDSRNATCLDAGSGWGALSFPLAKRFKQVVGMDLAAEKVKFVKVRKEQEKCDNLFLSNGSVLSLPFRNETFDLVVLNGVLEWTPLSQVNSSPSRVQEEVLKQANRVLKKGGLLYLAIENRFAATLFAGFKDEHTNLRFVTLLPRILARFYSRLLTGRDYREFTHSLGAYKKLLKAAGFKNIEAYAPLPGYRHFTYLLPIEEEKKIFDFFLDSVCEPLSPISLFLMRTSRFISSIGLYRLVKYFMPDFSFFCYK